MRVRNIKTGKEIYVFILYWAEGGQCYYVKDEFDPNNFEFQVEGKDVELIDSDLSGYVISEYGEDKTPVIVYKSLLMLDDWLDISSEETVIHNQFLKNDYSKIETMNKIPPLDIIYSLPSYPLDAGKKDTYYFCPTCFEANELTNVYDEAICCESCKNMYSVKGSIKGTDQQ